MFCTKCGKELEENVRFCTSCGAAVKIKPNQDAEPGGPDGAVDQSGEIGQADPTGQIGAEADSEITLDDMKDKLEREADLSLCEPDQTVKTPHSEAGGAEQLPADETDEMAGADRLSTDETDETAGAGQLPADERIEAEQLPTDEMAGADRLPADERIEAEQLPADEMAEADEFAEEMDDAEPAEIGSVNKVKARSPWSPVTIGITAVAVAVVTILSVYFVVISEREYTPISFTEAASEESSEAAVSSSEAEAPAAEAPTAEAPAAEAAE